MKRLFPNPLSLKAVSVPRGDGSDDLQWVIEVESGSMFHRAAIVLDSADNDYLVFASCGRLGACRMTDGCRVAVARTFAEAFEKAYRLCVDDLGFDAAGVETAPGIEGSIGVAAALNAIPSEAEWLKDAWSAQGALKQQGGCENA